MLPAVGGVGHAAGRASRRAAVLDAARLARAIPLDGAAQNAALRRRVAACYREWYEQVDARPGSTLPRSWLTACWASAAAIPLLGLIAGWSGGLRGALSIVYDFDAAALLLAVFRLAVPVLRAAAREARFGARLGWALLLDRSRPARPGLVPPDGMLLLLRATVAIRAAAAGGAMPGIHALVSLANDLSRAARAVAADPAMSGMRVPRRLLTMRRERNVRLACALEQVASKILVTESPERLERIGAFLTEALRAWACGALAAFVADLPQPERTLSPLAWLWAKARGAFFAAAAFATWLVGGHLAALSGPLLILGVVLQTGVPGPVDFAKYLLSGVSPAGAAK